MRIFVKKMKKILILFSVIALLFSCATTESAQEEAPIAIEAEDVEAASAATETEAGIENTETEPEIKENSVILIDDEQRAATNIDINALALSGYDYGDIFAVQAGDAFFYAPLVPDTNAMQDGEWYITVEAGQIIIGRCGEAADIPVGAEIQFSLSEKEGFKTRLVFSRLYPVNTTLKDFNSYSAGSLRANYVFTIYYPLINSANMERLEDLVVGTNIATVVDLSGKIDVAAVPAFENVNFYSADSLAEALRVIMSSNKPYLIILDESEASIMVAPVLESVMGARLDEILNDCITPYADYYGVEKDDPAYELMSDIIVDYYTALNGGEAPRDKSLLSLSTNYLRYTLDFSIDEVFSLRQSLR